MLNTMQSRELISLWRSDLASNVPERVHRAFLRVEVDTGWGCGSTERQQIIFHVASSNFQINSSHYNLSELLAWIPRELYTVEVKPILQLITFSAQSLIFLRFSVYIKSNLPLYD